MAKKYYYAVKAGYNPGIYENWDECKKQTEGFPGASHKKFKLREEAEAFLGKRPEPKPVLESKRRTSSEAVAYVDGSYDDTTKTYSYGVVIFHDEIEEHFSGKMNDSNLIDMRNVAGEIEAAKKAMQFCIDNGIRSVDIYYDYQGISKWCNGEWNTNKSGTKAYKSFYDGIKTKLSVNFIKVKGHSGDEYNDLADALAKSALGLGKQPDITQKPNNMTANNIKRNDFESILELLKEEIPDLAIEKYEHPYGQGYLLSITKPKQKLKVVHFNGKNKIWLQGKKEDLFNQLSAYIVELLDTDEVPRFLNTVYNLNVDTDVVEAKFNDLLPNIVGRVNEKVNRTLHQAVYNLNISEAPYDASFIAEPAIRVLEAILKIALKENNFPIRKKNKPYDSFFIFGEDTDTDSYIIKEEYIRPEHSQEILDYLSKLYTHFNKNRHTLSHWDDPKAEIDTTRLCETPNEAHTLIVDTLHMINEYFTI